MLGLIKGLYIAPLGVRIRKTPYFKKMRGVVIRTPRATICSSSRVFFTIFVYQR